MAPIRNELWHNCRIPLYFVQGERLFIARTCIFSITVSLNVENVSKILVLKLSILTSFAHISSKTQSQILSSAVEHKSVSLVIQAKSRQNNWRQQSPKIKMVLLLLNNRLVMKGVFRSFANVMLRENSTHLTIRHVTIQSTNTFVGYVGCKDLYKTFIMPYAYTKNT